MVAAPLADPHALAFVGAFSSNSGSMEAPGRSSNIKGSMETPVNSSNSNVEWRQRPVSSRSSSMEAPGRSSSSSDCTRASGRSSNSSGSMEAPRSSGRIILVDSSSSVGIEAAVTRSNTHISRNSSASNRRGQGALVGLATPGVAGVTSASRSVDAGSVQV